MRPTWGEVAPAPLGMTADELLRVNERADDGRMCELVEGLLVCEGLDAVSAAHGELCFRIGGVLGVYAKDTGSRVRVLQHALFDLTPAGASVTTALAPDVAILSATMPISWTEAARQPPLLAVEVAAPSQRPSDMALKTHTYLRSGVEQVWGVYDQTRSVEVLTARGVTRLGDTETLASPLLQGFSVAVRFLLDG